MGAPGSLGTELGPRGRGRAAQSLLLPIPPPEATMPSAVPAAIDRAFQLQPPLVNQ